MTNLLVKTFIKDYENTQNTMVRQRYGTLGSLVGIICNVVLFVAKLVAGFFTASIAIMADSFNNLSDAGSSIVSLVGFKMASKPADDDHPFGHGRAEYISGFVISIIIIIMGFELGRSSIIKIFNPEPAAFSLLSIIIMVCSVLLKLWMAFFQTSLGKKFDSATLKTTAKDSISDVVATTAVIVCMLISLFTSLELDAYAGVLVALFILYTGINTSIETMNLILGQAPDTSFVKTIEKKVMSYPNIMGIHDLIVHNYGPNNCVISLHAEVPCNGDILEIHDTIDEIERELKAELNCEAVIHMDPIVTDDIVTNAMKEKVYALVRLIDKSISLHDFRMVEGRTHTNLIFDIVVPHKFRLTDKEVIESIVTAVSTLDPTFRVVITVDKSYAHL